MRSLRRNLGGLSQRGTLSNRCSTLVVAALGAVPTFSLMAQRLLHMYEWPTPDLFMQDAQICPAPNMKYVPESQFET
jgi:hypothetical protein